MESSRGYEMLLCGVITENMFDYGEILRNLSRKLQRITTLIVSYNWEIGEANIDIPSYCRNLLDLP